MSDHEPGPEEGGEERDSKDNLALAGLVKRALGTPVVAKDAPDILVGVQRKLRERSRGKFYGDGWSTANTGMSYMLVSLIMLVLMGLAYFAIGPLDVLPR